MKIAKKKLEKLILEETSKVLEQRSGAGGKDAVGNIPGLTDQEREQMRRRLDMPKKKTKVAVALRTKHSHDLDQSIRLIKSQMNKNPMTRDEANKIVNNIEIGLQGLKDAAQKLQNARNKPLGLVINNLNAAIQKINDLITNAGAADSKVPAVFDDPNEYYKLLGLAIRDLDEVLKYKKSYRSFFTFERINGHYG